MGRIGQKLKRLTISMALTAIVAVIGAFGVSAYDANTNLLKKYEQTKASGTVNVGIYGSYINDINNAINRVNTIRKEACDQGVWDPRNPSRKLTPSDYVPIKWSYELEETARLRAAEAAINIDHTRPNGLSCFSVETTFFSNGEVLAWNYNKDMVSGINQFYAEKTAWVNKNTSQETGHYTQMIDPSNTYMGLGCFYSNSKVPFPNTLCGRFSSSKSTSVNTSRGSAVSNCYVPVQVPTSKLKDASLKLVSGKAALRTGESASYELWANAYYYVNTNVLLYEATWKSSNTKVATVDKYGKITGVGAGTATITATCGSISKSINISVKERIDVSKCTVSLSGTSFTYTGSVIKPTVTVKYSGTTLKNGTDYTVTYKANTNVGTATVVITGIEDYKGTVSKTFTIKAKPISSTTATLSSSSFTYDGKAKIPSVTVKNGSITLKSGTDYTVAYKDNTKVGTGTVTITGKGNYTGTKTLSFKIYPAYVRIAGNNRYLTSVEISKKSYTTADTVIIASGDAFADALAGVPLAKAYKAPLLLVSKDRILDETLSEISRLNAKTAIILGGTGAVSKNVENKIKNRGLKIDRLNGSTRFETSTMIAQKLADKTSAPKSVFFVYYNDFPDALSISSVAAIEGSPVLYVKTSGDVDEYTKQFISKYRSTIQNAYIIGGTGVISNAMADKIKNCVGMTPLRVSGQNRYETCVAVNKQFASLFNQSSAICVAKGLDFPDALAGGVFAALKGSPVFLADKSLSSLQTSYLKDKSPTNLWVFGGTGAVSDTLVQSVRSGCV